MSSSENLHELYTLDCIIDFGMYKGSSVQEVLKVDPRWLVWAHENLRGFLIEQRLYETLVYSNKQYNNPGPVSKNNPHGNPWITDDRGRSKRR